MVEKRTPMRPGQRYNRLVSVRMHERRGSNYFWVFDCDCGRRAIIHAVKARSGHTKSCGCFMREEAARRESIHGMHNSPAYHSWESMIQRCNNPAAPGYAQYGARGIRVCKRWESFSNFIEDMGDRPSLSHSLDRINNAGDYTPDNCRWATTGQQARNKRNNVFVTFGGKKMCLTDACVAAGVSRSTVMKRVGKGMSFDDALKG